MIYFILYKKVPSIIMQMITLCHMKATNLDQLITVLAEIESRKRSLYPVYPAKKHR
jgi:hypothetical protein